uniref:Ribosome assembly protein 3 n=1 Tax=Globodera pallida TaxID=36090 RepID=A0A183BHK2_GLOPA
MATAMDNKKGLDESILDDFSDEETPPKRAKVAEGIMATIDCQPSTSREGNQTGTGKIENEIGALVQANPMFVSQLATAKRESNDQRQPHQLAATASETLHELAEHFRTSNPELAILLVALEAGMAELSYHAKTGHWCSR